MKVDLHYGKAFLSLQIPEANVDEIIQPYRDQGKADNITLLREALAVKEADNFQDRIAGMRLCVLVDDGTRDEPFDDIFRQVFGTEDDKALIAETAKCPPDLLGCPFKRWSLEKLRNNLVAEKIVSSICIETLRTILHERKVKLRRTKTWKSHKNYGFFNSP